MGNVNDLSLGERISIARRRAGIDGRTLAAQLDTTQGSISNWERDKASPSLDKIARLAEILGVDLLWLAFGQVPEYADRQRPRPAPGEEGDGSSTKWYAPMAA